jgi:HAD superfamily hydrolase (TIGR01484 family)
MLRGIRKAYDIGPTTDNDDCVADDGGSIRHFFPATGKSRAGAIISLGPDIGSLLLNIPGVYVQGLYCVDGNGNVIFEKRLPTSAIRAAERLASEYGLSVVAYDGDDLYTTDRTDIVVRLSEYHGEPEVNLLIDEVSGRPMELADHVPGAHKLLLMHDDLEKLAIVRSRLEEVASTHDATVTVALPTMLELLPAGCSKAYGVERVCEALGVDPTAELLALGDAENDSEMLRMASIGVAVGNACPIAKDAADFVMRERNDEGGAGLAMNLFGF